MENNRIQWAKERTEFWIKFYRERFPSLNIPTVRILFSNKLRTTAGLAYTRQCVIKYSTHFLMNEGDVFDRTIAHEVAHIVVDNIYGIGQKHNYLWRKIFGMSGHAVTRCHSYQSAKRNKKTRIQFNCNKCNRELLTTKNTFNRLSINKNLFLVCHCKNAMRYDTIAGIAKRITIV